MIDNLFFTLTLLSALGCGLMAGVFFIFSNTVMSALARLQPPQGIAAMQSINRTILNPLFFAAFLGTAATSILLAISLLWRWQQPGAVYILAGSLLYLVGAIVVTIVFNVPMNEALEMFEVDSIGLDKLDRTILISIIEKFGGGPVGIDTIAAAVSEDKDTIEEVYEPYLIRQGLLQKTPRGRTVTLNAYEHLDIPKPTRQSELF